MTGGTRSGHVKFGMKQAGINDSFIMSGMVVGMYTEVQGIEMSKEGKKRRSEVGCLFFLYAGCLTLIG